MVYGPNNRYIKAFGEPGQFKPIDVAIAEDRLFVTDAMNHKVHILDKQSGETLFTIGESGSKKGQLLHPTNIAIASDGSVYVVDTTNSRVQKFSPAGTPVWASLDGGTGSGQSGFRCSCFPRSLWMHL